LCDVWSEVLGLERVGIYDNFFHIGGDSIVAIRVISKAKEENLEFSVIDIFNTPTISGLAPKLKQTNGVQEVYEPQSLLTEAQKVNVKSKFPLGVQDAYPGTQLQLGMLMEAARDIGVYHDVLSYRVNASFEMERFQKNIEELVQKHEVLRTCFIEDVEAGFLGVVAISFEPSIQIFHNDFKQEDIVLQELKQGFDFSQPPYRFVVSEIKENQFLFTFSLHHAIIDGWSVASLVTELTDAYIRNQTISPYNENLPKYGEYVKKEREAIQNEESNTFWSEYLSSYEAPKFPLVQHAKSNEVKQYFQKSSVSAKDTEILLDLAKDLGTTVDSLFLALYHKTLCQFEGTRDYILGLVTNNRLEQRGGDKLLGLFLNTIPFRPNTKATTSLEELFKKVASEKNKVLAHKQIPYGTIKSKWTTEETDYKCAFNYIHFHVSKGENSNNNPEFEYEKINIPMLLTVAREEGRFDISLAAHQGSIGADSFEKFWQYYNEAVQHVCNNYQQLATCKIYDISKSDVLQLRQWNNVSPAEFSDKTLHELFTKQAKTTPEAAAIRFKDETLTYEKLDTLSDTLAVHIQKRYQSLYATALKPGTPIGMYFKRSPEMIISMLAILKAGGAFVPISHNHPNERTAFIVNETGAPFVLTENAVHEQLKEALKDYSSAEILVYDRSLEVSASEYTRSTDASQLAYIIFTSGTTGNPKGVAISHGASSSRNWFMSQVGDTASNRYLFKTNYIFDVSVSDVFSHLFVGAEIRLAEAIFDLNEIENVIQNQGINASHFVPSQFPTIVEADALHKSLDTIYFSGEALKEAHLAKIDLNTTNVINYYGPTETGEVTWHKVKSKEEGNNIGKPFHGAKVYVLDTEMLPVPVGVPGELFISGAGLAEGYFNQSELTDKSFLKNHLASDLEKEQGYGKLYKTGDVVRWLQTGDLQYMGRRDNQIKIRGYRIELQEIETRLAAIEGIRESAVIIHEEGENKQLVAYAVKNEGADLTEAFIQRELEHHLPEYMVPDICYFLDQIPLTQNGKLDRKALPSPQLRDAISFVPPSNETEEKLCAIWKLVLDLDEIGINDNFFRLGGNSINAIRIVSMMKRDLQVEVSLPVLFRDKTIAVLAKNLKALAPQNTTKLLDKEERLSAQTNKMRL